MKKVLLLLIAVAFCSAIFAQNTENMSGESNWKTKGFEPQIRISFDEGIDYQKNFSFGADFVASYRFNEILDWAQVLELIISI